MTQQILKKKAANAIDELMIMAHLHRTNGDTEAADEFARFAASVGDMLAEIKRLDHQCASILKTAKQANQLSSDILDERNQARAERDQLKVEVARSTEREIMQLAEIEVLHKDAVRYRWLRQYTVKSLPVSGALASLDREIDAAMGKEEKV